MSRISPYNTGLLAEISNQEHDRLSLEDMSYFWKMLSELRDLGAHGQSFSSSLQGKAWNELLTGEVKEVVKQKMLDAEDPATQRTSVFEVDAKAKHYMQALGIYISSPRGKWLQGMSVADCYLHFWEKRLLESNIFSCVGHMGMPDF